MKRLFFEKRCCEHLMNFIMIKQFRKISKNPTLRNTYKVVRCYQQSTYSSLLCMQRTTQQAWESNFFKIRKDEIKYYDSDTFSILSNICKKIISIRIDNISQEDIEAFNKEDQIAYLLHEIREEKPYFLPIINTRDLERVIQLNLK